MDSNTKGKITELEVLSYVIKKGYSVSIPFGDKDRYDQIWDINGRLLKIQIKTSSWKNVDKKDAFSFKTCSIYARHNGYKANTYSQKDIDFFATIVEGQVYVVPVNECGSASKILRFSSDSKQKKNINWASNYTFEKIIENKK